MIEQTKSALLALDPATQESQCQTNWETEILPQAELYNSFGCEVPSTMSTETTLDSGVTEMIEGDDMGMEEETTTSGETEMPETTVEVLPAPAE